MNPQYFGDTRDLFKFDLVRHLMKSFPRLTSFTFIPMLTEGETGQKAKKSPAMDLDKAKRNMRAGSRNSDLIEHLKKLQEIRDDMEYFAGISAYFRKESIIIDILHTAPFVHKDREQYFSTVFKKLPKKSLIFLDPDTGLEVKSPTRRHLLHAEVKWIYEAMDPQSILMIYQHFPRQLRAGYVRKRCSELCEYLNQMPITITDNEIVFFLVTKNPKMREQVAMELETYANTYPVLDSLCGFL